MVLDGYIRISQVGGRSGERFISPDVQREAISRCISGRGALVGEIYEELDKSGMRSANRPGLLEVINRIESGVSDGLVVARLSRFGRSFEDGVRLIGRIQRAGGTLISVHEGFDLGTPTGRLVTNILFSVAEWEIEAKREYSDEARRKRIERGAYVAGAPFGYLNTDAGPLEIDPASGSAVTEVFRRRAAGQRIKQIVDFLNDSPAKTKSGVPFGGSYVNALLKNPAYKGTARAGPYVNHSAHEPLVEPELWQLCQAEPHDSYKRVEMLLNGRIRCAHCGGLMYPIGSEDSAKMTNHYGCRGKGGCASPGRLRGEELDPLVEEFIFLYGKTGRTAKSVREILAAEDAVKKAERDLASYRDNVSAAHTLGPERFEEGLATRMQFLERRLLQLARVKRARKVPQIDLRALAAEWPALSWDQRRAAVGEVIDFVVVERGPGPAIERCWIFRKGRGPALLRGERLDFPRWKRRALRLHEHRRWAEEQIEAELREFYDAGDPRWPSYLKFTAAGRGRLHAQIMAWGGPYFWASRLGIEIRTWVGPWDQRKIRGALRPLLADRGDWPTRREFREAGLGRLHDAIKRHGGYQFWADQFEVAYTRHRDPKWLRWSSRRIEQELRVLLEGCESFPSTKELESSGSPGLYGAIRMHGGLAFWAERFKLPMRYGKMRGGAGARPPVDSSGKRGKP